MGEGEWNCNWVNFLCNKSISPQIFWKMVLNGIFVAQSLTELTISIYHKLGLAVNWIGHIPNKSCRKGWFISKLVEFLEKTCPPCIYTSGAWHDRQFLWYTQLSPHHLF